MRPIATGTDRPHSPVRGWRTEENHEAEGEVLSTCAPVSDDGLGH